MTLEEYCEYANADISFMSPGEWTEIMGFADRYDDIQRQIKQTVPPPPTGSPEHVSNWWWEYHMLPADMRAMPMDTFIRQVRIRAALLGVEFPPEEESEG